MKPSRSSIRERVSGNGVDMRRQQKKDAKVMVFVDNIRSCKVIGFIKQTREIYPK